MTDRDSQVAAFLYEVGHLKNITRAGWPIAGVSNPESVAEHSYRVGVIAYVIAALEGANADRACTLGVFHDMPETRTGDVPSVGKEYVTTTAPATVAADQVAGLPAELAGCITKLIAEHESAKGHDATPEARCSRDADKIECLLQARQYQEQGNTNMGRYVDSMLREVATPTGKALAKAAAEVSPSAWWDGFAARFGTKK